MEPLRILTCECGLQRYRLSAFTLSKTFFT